MYDHDSAAVGEQVRSFTVDGSDLTALLNAAFDATGGKQAEYNTYTLAIPTFATPNLADGSATFSLTLQGPCLIGVPGSSDTYPGGNGAGLDFATLSIVPEPHAASMGALLMATSTLRRRTRRRTGGAPPLVSRRAL